MDRKDLFVQIFFINRKVVEIFFHTQGQNKAIAEISSGWVLISSTSFLVIAFIAFSRLLGCSHTLTSSESNQKGPCSYFPGLPSELGGDPLLTHGLEHKF